MIFALIPYYHPDTLKFADSLARQTKHSSLRINRMKRGIYWTEAMRMFQDMLRLARKTDVVIILNNDIELSPHLFEFAQDVRPGEVYIPHTLGEGYGMEVDWLEKRFTPGEQIQCFAPRGIALRVEDFLAVKFCKWLPHYLADIDWSIRLIEYGVRPVSVPTWIRHEKHDTSMIPLFSWLNPRNPIAWTVFLFRNCPLRHLPLNLLRAWWEVPRQIWWGRSDGYPIV